MRYFFFSRQYLFFDILFSYVFPFLLYCSITVAPTSLHYSPIPYPPPPATLNPPPPLPLSMGPLYMFLDDSSPSSPHYPLPASSLITLSLFFISLSLAIFACLFVLLFRFHLWVRSYGICLSLPVLFHLA